jgi:hypothetical protein
MCLITYLKVGILVREWALGRWQEGEQVSLAEELPAVHARNRAERERQAAAAAAARTTNTNKANTGLLPFLFQISPS